MFHKKLKQRVAELEKKTADFETFKENVVCDMKVFLDEFKVSKQRFIDDLQSEVRKTLKDFEKNSTDLKELKSYVEELNQSCTRFFNESIKTSESFAECLNDIVKRIDINKKHILKLENVVFREVEDDGEPNVEPDPDPNLVPENPEPETEPVPFPEPEKGHAPVSEPEPNPIRVKSKTKRKFKN